MKATDATFLTVHPRTVLWWAQREKCESCKHCRVHSVKTTRCVHGGILRCAKTYDPSAGATGLAYCIDAREPDQRCGPDAKLFKPKE